MNNDRDDSVPGRRPVSDRRAPAGLTPSGPKVSGAGGEPLRRGRKTLASRVGESVYFVMYGLIALEIVLALLGARAAGPPAQSKSST